MLRLGAPLAGWMCRDALCGYSVGDASCRLIEYNRSREPCGTFGELF
jgi:hypothetical protein